MMIESYLNTHTHSHTEVHTDTHIHIGTETHRHTNKHTHKKQTDTHTPSSNTHIIICESKCKNRPGLALEKIVCNYFCATLTWEMLALRHDPMCVILKVSDTPITAGMIGNA